jgi:hypothetical protein
MKIRYNKSAQWRTKLVFVENIFTIRVEQHHWARRNFEDVQKVSEFSYVDKCEFQTVTTLQGKNKFVWIRTNHDVISKIVYCYWSTVY